MKKVNIYLFLVFLLAMLPLNFGLAQTVSESDLSYYYADLVPEASYTKINRSGLYPGLVTYARTVTNQGTAPQNPRYSFYRPADGPTRTAIEMDPSAKRNRRFVFNGQEMTILNPNNYGHYIIVDRQTGKEFVAGCLNEKVGSTLAVTVTGPAISAANCNCPDLKKDTKQEIVDPYIDQGNQRILIYDDGYGAGGFRNQKSYTYDFSYQEEPTKTWLGQNWWWVVPIGTAILGGVVYVVYKLINPTKTTTIVYTNPDDPNNPNPGEDHNPNGTVIGLGYQTGLPPSGAVTNTVLPSFGVSSGGFAISF